MDDTSVAPLAAALMDNFKVRALNLSENDLTCIGVPPEGGRRADLSQAFRQPPAPNAWWTCSIGTCGR